MGGSMSEGLRVVFAIVVTCLVIGFVFIIWNSVKESGNTALTDANSMITQMDEAKYTQYEGAIVTGSEVINVIKQNATNDIYIGVDVGAGMVGYVFSDATLSSEGADLAEARKKTSATYINPNSKFVGKVIRSDSGTDALVGVEFTKQ